MPSILAITSAVSLGRTPRAPRLSSIWLSFVAPVMTVLTCSFFAHHASASCTYRACGAGRKGGGETLQYLGSFF